MRCKVGDLVVVLGGGRDHLENIGRFGTILRASDWPGFDWFVKPATTFVGTDALRQTVDDARPASFADSSLQPIRPSAKADERVAERELQHA